MKRSIQMFCGSVDNEVRSQEASPTVIIGIHMNIAPGVAFTRTPF